MSVRHVEHIDCHARLQDPLFEGAVEAVLKRAYQAGVAYMVTPARAQAHWPILHDMAMQSPCLIPCFGVHPDSMRSCSQDWHDQLKQYLTSLPAAVGTIGLDYSLTKWDRRKQERVFLEQVVLANQVQRPVVIEAVRAWSPLNALLQEVKPAGGICIEHYRGPVALIDPLVNIGSYFSYSGFDLLSQGKKYLGTAKAVPLHRLLISTHAPGHVVAAEYGPYHRILPNGRWVNEPANLPHMIPHLARVLELDAVQLAEALNHNSFCLFGSLMRSDG